MSADRARAHWAAHFGLPEAAFDAPGVHVTAHVGLRGYRGVWAFRRGDTWVVSAPPECVDALRGEPLDAARLHDRDALRTWLGAPDATVIGPAWWGRLEPARFRPIENAAVHRVDPNAPALDAFRTDIGADWGASGIDPDAMAMFGAHEGDMLVALAACRLRVHGASDPCIVTHPDWRGRGLGTAATSAACAHLLREGHLVLYQTLAANAPAVAVARRLGFRDDATHLAVRLAG